ncbi:tripartite tricarboxylate transporter substrate binding protein [Xylophilus rhododendri]|uniref:Tripartite tricarboxylate transporter substrate binding protein n=1 Tax=Xylophilus rhododendri TaxID=2697032 RepID=A0A857J3P7_9BURK|nr:tripartite tricarboxylate transporter substrate binding protein [Xylophilus rhododendri]QHI98554.1 tripartite tricarboxylate transporter substrate binding protein [Xylophilus rhododendri]
MNLLRTVLLHVLRMPAVAAALALSGFAVPALAAWPDQPIHFVVPYPAGGSTDVMARTLGQRMSEVLGQPVIVENRAGASANIGTNYVAKSKPDGYTILLATSTALSVNPSLFKNLPFDPQKDLSPILLAATMPNIVVVGKNVKADSLPELNALIKRDPTQASYASAGNGTPSHLGAELYKRTVGLDVSQIPYKGGAPALQDLVGGQTTFMIAVMPEAMPLVKDGQLKALAITTKNRLPELPNLPTVAETVPGYELTAWYGILAAAGTPEPIVRKFNTVLNDALKDPVISAKFKTMGFDLLGGPPSALTQLMVSETPKWKQVIEAANIKVD